MPVRQGEAEKQMVDWRDELLENYQAARNDALTQEATALWEWDTVGCCVRMSLANWPVERHQYQLSDWIAFWKEHGNTGPRSD